MKIKNFKRIYVDIVISCLIIAVVATFFAFKSQTISQEQVLNTLSEISSQSVNVIDKEIQKNVAVLANLSIYISQEDAFDPVKIINKIKKVNEINNFKRIGIIDERGQSYTTDDNNILLNEQQMTRFNKAMNGEVSITDTLPDLIDGEEVSVYTLPITFDNDQHCVLFGAYASRYYKETLSVSTFDGLGYSFIIKENGDKIVDSSNKTSIKFSNFFDDIGAISKENKEKLENLKHNIKNEKSGFLEYDRTDEARYLYYQKLDVNDWYLLSVIPASVVDNNINGMLFLGYMMLGCCLLGILYLITRIVLMYRNNQKRLEEAGLLHIGPMLGNYYYVFNVKAEPFTDPNVRKAFSMVINRANIVNNIVRGGKEPAYAFVPYGMLESNGREDFREAGSYLVYEDVEQAKEILKEAGYGKNRPLPQITILYNTSELHKAIAEAIQDAWINAFGADVRLQNQETKVFLADREAGKYQVARASWVADYSDPQNFLEVFSAEDNDGQYHSDEYNELIARIRTTPNGAARDALMHEAEKMIFDESLVMPLYFTTQPYVTNGTIQNYFWTTLGLVDFKKAYK